MFAAGTAFTVTVSGVYGIRAASNLQEIITALLNSQGLIVSSFIDDEPGSLSRALSFAPFTYPYQFRFACTSQVVLSDAQLRAAFSFAVVEASGSAPSSISVDSVNGQSTGEARQPAPVSTIDQIGATAKSALDGIAQPLTLLVIVLVVGVVLVAQSGSVKVHV